MSFDSDNCIPLSSSEEANYSNSNHLSLVSNNTKPSIDFSIEELQTYLRLVEDSVNMLFMTAILEKKIKRK